MSTKQSISRRQFLIGFALAGTGAGLTSLWYRTRANRVLGANDRIRTAVIGLGSRGSHQLQEYLQLPGVEVCALCDVNEKPLLKNAETIWKTGLPRPATFTDFRRILDSQEIDAISIATPAGLHAAMAIAACEAGKDVYVEKPCALNFSEGKRLVAAAEKYGRIVQQRMGTTFAISHGSIALLTSPNLGDVRQVRGIRSLGVPAAPLLPGLIHEAFDELDFARAMLDVGLPTHVSTVGATRAPGRTSVNIRMLFNSAGKDERTLDFQLETKPFQQASDFESFNTFVTPNGDFTVRSDSLASANQTGNDLANFVSCVRDRQPQWSNFPVAEAQVSCALVQLAQLSLQHRRTFAFDPQSERVIGDQEIDSCLAAG